MQLLTQDVVPLPGSTHHTYPFKGCDAVEDGLQERVSEEVVYYFRSGFTLILENSPLAKQDLYSEEHHFQAAHQIHWFANRRPEGLAYQGCHLSCELGNSPGLGWEKAFKFANEGFGGECKIQPRQYQPVPLPYRNEFDSILCSHFLQGCRHCLPGTTLCYKEMYRIKSKAFTLKTAYVAAGLNMLLADKDALALSG